MLARMFCSLRLVSQAFGRRLGFVGLGLSFIVFSAAPVSATIGVAYQMLLGNPSSATADPSNHSHYLIQRDVEALDFNDTRRLPNWASWNLTTSDTGSSGRSSSFYADASLPSGFYQVQSTGYSGSGYDRGHMCPSGDRTDTVADNDETFLMSNIIPQSPDNNQGVWANLEGYCRTLAAAGNEVLITCGPEGFSGARTASSGLVYIPSNVWKIIVVVPPGVGETLNRISNSTRVITVSIPNVQGVRSDPWQNYLTSVNQLETNTGLTFFTALNPNLAAVLRAKIDGAPAIGITNFIPTMGDANTSVVIRGTNFTGTTAVSFNGQETSFTLDSPNEITATVPSGALSGPISVIAAGGLSVSASTFTVSSPTAAPPTLTISASGPNLLLAWPANAAGFTLQQTPDLNPGNWTSYPGLVTLSGSNRTAMLAPIGNRLFFRLSATVP